MSIKLQTKHLSVLYKLHPPLPATPPPTPTPPLPFIDLQQPNYFPEKSLFSGIPDIIISQESFLTIITIYCIHLIILTASLRDSEHAHFQS